MPNPFAHVELNTDDPKQAEKFYRSIFDWKVTPRPELNYTMIDVGTGTGGGLQKKPTPDAPSAWLPYVSVDDVKKTLAKARKAGAKIVLDYTEIGTSMGAIGVFVDPLGATLGLWEAPAAAKPAEAAPPAKTAAKPAKSAKPQAPSKPVKAAAKSATAAKPAPAKAPAAKAAAAKAPAKAAAKSAPKPVAKPAAAKKTAKKAAKK